MELGFGGGASPFAQQPPPRSQPRNPGASGPNKLGALDDW